MSDADKRNVIQSSDNIGWYRSVKPTLGAKDMRTGKNEPEVPSAVSEARSNRRMMWKLCALACGNLLPIASTRFRVAEGAFGKRQSVTILPDGSDGYSFLKAASSLEYSGLVFTYPGSMRAWTE
jgi:hypothetical protein